MKLCFSTLGCVEKNWDEILLLARKYGINGLEIRGIGGVLNNADVVIFSEEKATKTKEEAKAAAISPVVLGTSCMFHTEECLSTALLEGKAAIEIAQRMGIPYIRVFGNNFVGDQRASTERVVKGISALCEMAKGTGVSVLLEVHGDFNTVEALSPITDALSAVDNFGLIWDVAHTHAPYGENWVVFYEKMRPYIRHVHIKDRKNGGGLVLTGEGAVPILPIIKRMLSDGFDGYFSFEWERYWHPELPDMETALAGFARTVRGGSRE